MKSFICALAVTFVISAVFGDIYLHNPRGSNNRLDEANRNRNNDNRLFDSQNNNKGGYNQDPFVFYGGSELEVQWTNQHGCGDRSWGECQLVMQYMCETSVDGGSLRDGTNTNTIDTNAPNTLSRGRHETIDFYNQCASRQRNANLFLADQEANLNGDEAIYTRQNTNGERFGFECPEERDYYPYWHPTSWRDIVVITTQAERLCPMYRAESQNVREKYHCTGLKAPDPNNANKILSGSYYNNEGACIADGFTWTRVDAWNIGEPDCVEASVNHWSRINHLGNGQTLNQNSYKWILPEFGQDMICVFRMRYNISTGDYDGWDIDASSNGADSPVKDNPTYDILTGTTTSTGGVRLKLSMNTDQFGRTFEDRSHTMIIRKKTVGNGKRVVNLNVMGQRGNIVENYPSCEYDFVPTDLEVSTEDYIHRQVGGSNTSPDGAGQGRAETDRANFVQLVNRSTNYPEYLSNYTMLDDPSSYNTYKIANQWALYGQLDNELNSAAPHQDLGLQRYSSERTIHYYSTRANNFSNRSHKGSIYVNNSSKKTIFTPLVIAGIVAGGVIVLAAIGGVAFLAATGRISMPSFGKKSGGSPAPAGYA